MRRYNYFGICFGIFACLAIAANAQTPNPQGRGGSGANGGNGIGRGASLQGPPPTYKDIDYAAPEPADSKGHKLDIYIPAGATGALPTLLWSRGSAFGGDAGKENIGQIAKRFMDAGYVVVGVSQRGSNQVKFPGSIYDTKAAVRWLRANASKYNIDPNRIGFIGTSSGGWVGAMLALTGGVPELEGTVGTVGPSSKIQAAILFYPPTDFSQMDLFNPVKCVDGQGFGCHNSESSPESRLMGCKITDCSDKVQEANPVRYVDAQDPPIMIIHGMSDTTVPYEQGLLLYMKLKEACRDAVLIGEPNAPHGRNEPMVEDPQMQQGAVMYTSSSAGCKSETPKLMTPTWQTMIDFFDAHLKN